MQNGLLRDSMWNEKTMNEKSFWGTETTELNIEVTHQFILIVTLGTMK